MGSGASVPTDGLLPETTFNAENNPEHAHLFTLSPPPRQENEDPNSSIPKLKTVVPADNIVGDDDQFLILEEVLGKGSFATVKSGILLTKDQIVKVRKHRLAEFKREQRLKAMAIAHMRKPNVREKVSGWLTSRLQWQRAHRHVTEASAQEEATSQEAAETEPAESLWNLNELQSATDDSLSPPIAIKCFNPFPEEGQEQKERSPDATGGLAGLENEVRIMRKLSPFPSIIKFLGACMYVDKRVFVVMERINGGELFDQIVIRKFYSEREARMISRTLLTALKHIHDHNVVHRDIKPENILLRSPENISDLVLVDFGFSAEIEEGNDECLAQPCGSPDYVAAEVLLVAEGGKKYGRPSDLWSAGVIIFLLLGGYSPFVGADVGDTLNRVVHGDYKFKERYWGKISSSAKELVKSLLTRRVHKRLTAEEALNHPWMKAGDENVPSVALDQNLTSLSQWNEQRKRVRKFTHAVVAANRLARITSKALAMHKPLRDQLADSTDKHENFVENTSSPENLNEPGPTDTQNQDEATAFATPAKMGDTSNSR